MKLFLNFDLFFTELEHSLAVEKAEYDELTGKYEILEEEHVVTKARLTVEKEQAQKYVTKSPYRTYSVQKTSKFLTLAWTGLHGHTRQTYEQFL